MPGVVIDASALAAMVFGEAEAEAVARRLADAPLASGSPATSTPNSSPSTNPSAPTGRPGAAKMTARVVSARTHDTPS